MDKLDLIDWIGISVFVALVAVTLYISFYHSAQAKAVSTEIPVYKAKCNNWGLHYCKEWSIYKVTEY